MKLLNVEIEHCGAPTPGETPEEKAAAYNKFYPAAIADITDKVQAARKR